MPLNDVNNLGWTALIEALILGGGQRHVQTVHALLAAGTDVGLADGQGLTPLHRAEMRGYADKFFPPSTCDEALTAGTFAAIRNPMECR
jgi:ankyrin repeat protein